MNGELAPPYVLLHILVHAHLSILPHVTQWKIPPQTQKRLVFFAHTIFPPLETYRERLAPLYCADNGRPAWDPVRLLAVLVLHFVLRITDRQAAEAVPYDQRWRLALHMDPQEAAFDPSLLVVFRGRLVNGKIEALSFEAVLDYLVEQGWLPKRSRQRIGLNACTRPAQRHEPPGVCPRNDPPAAGGCGS